MQGTGHKWRRYDGTITAEVAHMGQAASAAREVINALLLGDVVTVEYDRTRDLCPIEMTPEGSLPERVKIRFSAEASAATAALIWHWKNAIPQTFSVRGVTVDVQYRS